MKQSGAATSIPFTPVMECLPVDRLPSGPDWVYELKLDGYRAQAIHDGRGVHLFSRNGGDFSQRFSSILTALKKALPPGTALDGELVGFDDTGRPSFNTTHNANAETAIVFFVFDVLAYRWKDVKHLPLTERLAILGSAFIASDWVQRSEQFAVPLDRIVSAVKELSGEGVVAKRLSSFYEAGKRSGAWSKMRINIGQEFVIGGFTKGASGVAALVVGFYDGAKLIYAARVRAGLIPATRSELYARLGPLAIATCPFANLPESKAGRWGQGLTAATMRECIWVRPVLVANFEFLEWTDSNHVQHIKYAGLREDKDPCKVTREMGHR